MWIILVLLTLVLLVVVLVGALALRWLPATSRGRRACELLIALAGLAMALTLFWGC